MYRSKPSGTDNVTVFPAQNAVGPSTVTSGFSGVPTASVIDFDVVTPLSFVKVQIHVPASATVNVLKVSAAVVLVASVIPLCGHEMEVALLQARSRENPAPSQTL